MSSGIHPCQDRSDTTSLYPILGLFLKPIGRINITIHFPTLKNSITNGGGKSVSSWEVMERIKGLVAPDNFISLKVVKNTLEFLRFEGDLETREVMKTIITRLEGKSLKLAGFRDPLKVRAAEAKVPFPSKYDWDSFFRDAKHMNEMKAGERPDTIHFQGLPCKWFSEKKASDKPMPSEKLFRKVWEIYGDVRCVDIPVLDPYRSQMQSNIAGIKTFTFTQDQVFEAYVQYKDYLSFVRAMDALRGCFLLYQEDNKSWVASMKVNFDKTKHMCDNSILQRRLERERLIEEEKKRERVTMTKAQEKSAETLKKDISKEEKKRMEYKIALEERMYMVARRKLESVRLLDFLFNCVKKTRAKVQKGTESDVSYRDTLRDSTRRHQSASPRARNGSSIRRNRSSSRGSKTRSLSRRRGRSHSYERRPSRSRSRDPESRYSRSPRKSRSRSRSPRKHRHSRSISPRNDRYSSRSPRRDHSRDRYRSHSPHGRHGRTNRYYSDRDPREYYRGSTKPKFDHSARYMHDWELKQDYAGKPYHSDFRGSEFRGRGRGRGDGGFFRGRGDGGYFRGRPRTRPYGRGYQQHPYDPDERYHPDPATLQEAYQEAYAKYFRSITKSSRDDYVPARKGSRSPISD